MELADGADDEGVSTNCGHYHASKNCSTNNVRILAGSERQVFVASRIRLCRLSPVFQAMLSGGWRESSGEIQIADTDPLVFGCFVSFIAAGDAKLTDDTVWEMLKLADKYQVEPLVFFCFRYLLTRHACCDQARHLISLMETAHRIHREDFRKCCLDRVKAKAREVLRDRKCLAEICQECMLTLVQASDLAVTDEVIVHQAVMAWARLACRRRGVKRASWEDLREEAGELVGHVRYLVIRQPARDVILSGDRHQSLLTGQEKRDLLYARDPVRDRYNGALFPGAVQAKREGDQSAPSGRRGDDNAGRAAAAFLHPLAAETVNPKAVVLSMLFFLLLPAFFVLCLVASLGLLLAAPCLMVYASLRGTTADVAMETHAHVLRGACRIFFADEQPASDSELDNDFDAYVV